jgi:hypothetical protein
MSTPSLRRKSLQFLKENTKKFNGAEILPIEFFNQQQLPTNNEVLGSFFLHQEQIM